MLINDVVFLNNTLFDDSRGTFIKWAYHDFDIKETYTTINKAKVFRGMHMQMGSTPQAKIVTCISGAVRDYILDLRPRSLSFGKYMHFDLNDPLIAVYVPAGCAHGYASKEPSIIHYAMDQEFSLNNYYTLNPEIVGIWGDWIVSEKDKKGMSIEEYEETLCIC